jgi:hypothetical protein
MKRLTKEEVNKKYKGKYVKFIKTFDWDKKIDTYEIVKVYNTIHEDTTLGEDVGTDMEYWR